MNNYYDKNFFKEDRWYHIYLYLITCTGIIGVIIAGITEWTTAPFVLAFVIMANVSTICFFVESAVMGFTAKAGGFFWTAVTCFGIVYYLLWPALS